MNLFRAAVFTVLALLFVSGCASRQVHDSLAGSTAQRLVTYSIEQLVNALPASDFDRLRGQRVWVDTHFISDGPLKDYADRRLKVALADNFGIVISPTALETDVRMTVFYTSLGTDEEIAGLYLPLGVVPGFDDASRVDLLTLEKFHGVAELYYFLETDGNTVRGPTLTGRIRTDALGLPIITIPLSTLPDAENPD